MSSTPIIEVTGLGKRYRLSRREENADTLVGVLTGWLRAPFERFRRLRDLTRFASGADSPDTLWALRDVSFEVREGEVLGIIGRNGAGKSTLLKILSRITPPSTGRVVLRGTVASLLEVGTGFHPELSGRENVYLNGTLLGLSRRQIDAQLDAIVDFAGVGPFLDTPIKRYSSGMQVRLAFSVAAHLDADILVVDEVLAVGDVDFQKKCLGRMGQLARSGRTVLFVSHNMAAVKALCDAGILLERGRVVAAGDVDEVVARYCSSTVPARAHFPAHNGHPTITYAEVDETAARRGDLVVTLGYKTPVPLIGLNPGVVVHDQNGTKVFGTNLRMHPMTQPPQPRTAGMLRVRIPDIPLHAGWYHVSLYLGDQHTNYVSHSEALSLYLIPRREVPNKPRAEYIGYLNVAADWREL